MPSQMATPKKKAVLVSAKRMSPNKVVQSRCSLSGVGKRDLLETVRKECMDKLKDDEELVWAVKGLIDAPQKASIAEDKCLPRGVRRVLGTNSSNGVPGYIMNTALQQLMNVTGSEVAALQGAEAVRLVCWGIDADRDTMLPATKMPVSELLEWFHKRHREHGARLSDPSIKARASWQWNCGHFYIGKKLDEAGMVHEIFHRRTRTVASIPPHYRCQIRHVGSHLVISLNEFEREAVLENTETGDKLLLSARLFKDAVELPSIIPATTMYVRTCDTINLLCMSLRACISARHAVE